MKKFNEFKTNEDLHYGHDPIPETTGEKIGRKVKSFFNWDKKKETPVENIVNTHNSPYVTIGELNYDNVIELLTDRLEGNSSVTVQVRAAGGENFKKILKELNIEEVGERGLGDKPWFYTSVAYKQKSNY